MSSCVDCGCKLSRGICSNCHEELYILEYQSDFVDKISPEFKKKADEQRKAIEDKDEEG